MRHPDTLEEISKERFEGTVLKAISRIRKVKKELAEEGEEAPKNGQAPLTQVRGEGASGLPRGEESFHDFNVVCVPQVKIKVEKMEEDEREGKAVEKEEREESVQVKTEKEEEDKCLPGGGAKAELAMGRLVMTVDGQQKQLPFCPNDLLSTATMFDGDRVSCCPYAQDLQGKHASHLSILCRCVLTSPHTQRPKRNGPHSWRSSPSPSRSPTNRGST